MHCIYYNACTLHVITEIEKDMNETKILEKLRELAAKHDKWHPIGIDSLALILKVSQGELKQYLTVLEQQGLVVIHTSSNNSRRRTLSGTVEYVEEHALH